jgi:hypothetical protein
MTASHRCRSPCRCCAEEKSGSNRKGENDSATAGTSYRRLRVCDGRIDPFFGIGRRKARRCCHHLNEVGTVVIGHSRVTGRGQEDATGFRAFGRKIDAGCAASGPKEAVKFIA